MCWPLWSHKLLRTVVPLWLVAVFVASAGLVGQPYRACFAAQILFYGLAALGWAAQHFRLRRFSWRIARVAYVFCLLNISAVVGFVRFLRGRQPVTWEKANG